MPYLREGDGWGWVPDDALPGLKELDAEELARNAWIEYIIQVAPGAVPEAELRAQKDHLFNRLSEEDKRAWRNVVRVVATEVAARIKEAQE